MSQLPAVVQALSGVDLKNILTQAVGQMAGTSLPVVLDTKDAPVMPAADADAAQLPRLKT